MARLFEDTKKANAHYYLDYMANEITREEFLEENREWHGTMLYVGGGYVLLTVAVLTADARGFHQPDVGAAIEIFEEWCRTNDRLEEIHEDDPDDEYLGEYELVWQSIPAEVEGND